MKYKDLAKLVKKVGWKEVRQKGSHVIFKHDTIKNPSILVIPNHGSKELGKGLVRKILKQAGID